jgi:hypothetical protein
MQHMQTMATSTELSNQHQLISATSTNTGTLWQQQTEIKQPGQTPRVRQLLLLTQSCVHD